MYPYSVWNKKPLAVGDQVWVNVGDTECAYAEWRKHPEWKFGYAMPSTSDKCLAEYHRARIVEIRYMDRHYVYRVEIEPWKPKNNFGEKLDNFEWNAEFDRLYEIFNLPERWSSYSKYFLALNW